ncbi:unnamed protein product [Tilletia laevis]|uniref:Uncharacterized protein n=2 Tax=Tilletia TaxID=13289 RepID=A0A177TDA6_9BASI|nr:hypothetical protein CF336_g8315 [Tilletia laevis]KAE8244268.1 hypothetical protein A4X03_0g7589 [Tilletia caries]CAD6970326.1 unnamed protein product [Tilletia controversa]KAE8184730.1 hypothetical protein CF335_g7936 [Tilletia laevis]CAD6890164.1 unnamed protein product [Tilletia caries]
MSSPPKSPRTPPPSLESAAILQFHALGLVDREKSPRYRRSVSPCPPRPRVLQPPASSYSLQQALGVHTGGTGGQSLGIGNAKASSKPRRLPEQQGYEFDASLHTPCLAPKPGSRARSSTMRRTSLQLASLELPEPESSTSFPPPSPSKGFAARMAERPSKAVPPPQLLNSGAQYNSTDQSNSDIETLRAGLQSAFTPTSTAMATHQQRASWQRSNRTRCPLDHATGSSSASTESSPCATFKLGSSSVRRATLSQAQTPVHAGERPPFPPQHHLPLDGKDVKGWSDGTGPMTPPLASRSSVLPRHSSYLLSAADDDNSDSSSEFEFEPTFALPHRAYPVATVGSAAAILSSGHSSGSYLKASHLLPKGIRASQATPPSSSPSTSTSSFSSSILSSPGWESRVSVRAGSPFN